jgi:2'-5' RNA ligase
MRLFSALVPPAPVLAHLSDHLAGSSITADGHPTELRWSPVDRWHVTLGFFGDDDDPVRRTRWLRRRAEGRPAPRLRLAGGGTFPGVLWVGVHPDTADDERRLAQLARAAGAGLRDFTAHLTLARWRSGAPEKDMLPHSVAAYTGPWFTPDAVVLMRSDFVVADSGRREPIYTAVERLPLVRA